MPLLRRDNLIINTDQIIKAEYKSGSKSSLILHMADRGRRSNLPAGSTDNVVMLTGFDADLMWSTLSQLATPVVPAPRK